VIWLLACVFLDRVRKVLGRGECKTLKTNFFNRLTWDC
jgi:hypothetical protein